MTRPFGLTSARWQVMGAIDLAPQKLTVSQIARRMGLARQGVQRISNDLSKLGLLQFEENVDHKRAKLATLTAHGQKVIDQISLVQTAWVNKLTSGFSEEQICSALEVLRSIQQKLEPERSGINEEV